MIQNRKFFKRTAALPMRVKLEVNEAVGHGRRHLD